MKWEEQLMMSLSFMTKEIKIRHELKSEAAIKRMVKRYKIYKFIEPH